MNKKEELLNFIRDNFIGSNIDGLQTEEEIENGGTIIRNHLGNKDNFTNFISINFTEDLHGRYNEDIKVFIKKWTKSQQL